VKTYGIYIAENALLKSWYYIREYTVCSVVRIGNTTRFSSVSIFTCYGTVTIRIVYVYCAML